jgi:hypothetical protein
MNLQDFVKKYIWDDEKTPYFRSVRRLTKVQADNEIRFYAVFLAVVFGAMEVISASAWSETGGFISGFIALYSLTVVGAAFVIWNTKDSRASWVLLSTPVATGMNFIFDAGIHGELGSIDRYVLIFFCLLWLRYGVRVLSITKAYDDMPQSR